MSSKSAWSQGLAHEIEYWDKWMSARGGPEGDQFARLLETGRPLNPVIARHLVVGAEGPVRVLDVGAGPITGLGTLWGDRRIELTAVDPLADSYNASLAANGITPPVRTLFGEAERLTDQFQRCSFDLVHASNCIDHCYAPTQAIASMLAVVKPGGSVLLEHASNEGVFEQYEGLHQWNFDVQAGNFVIWNPGGVFLVSQMFSNICETVCEVYPLTTGRSWLSIRMRKYDEGESRQSVQVPLQLSFAGASKKQPIRYAIADRVQSQVERVPLVRTLARQISKRLNLSGEVG